MYPSVLSWKAYSSCIALLHVIFSLRLLCRAQVLVQDNNVTCAVPRVEPLASTTLKCYFPEDVTQTKRDFSVYRYKEAIVAENILDCRWWSGKLKCYVSPGYQFTSILSHEVTLKIPRATVEYIGTYTCLLDSFKLNNSKTCEFEFKLVGKTMCDIPLVARQSQTSLTCYFPEDISKTRTGFTVYHYTSRGDKNDVIDCDWKEDSIVCNTARGYQFNHNVANHVTLKISSPSENHEGTYSCQIKGNESVRSEICSFMLLRETTSSCYITSVHEGDPTTLTCRFSADVNVTKRNVTVVRVSGKASKAVNILTCTWRNNQLGCGIAAGYEFNNTISDHLLIRIPQASRDHNGHYACHVLGSELAGFKQCPFIVVSGDDANLPVITIAISISVVLIIVVIGVFCVFWTHRKKQDLLVEKKNIVETIELEAIFGKEESKRFDEKISSVTRAKSHESLNKFGTTSNEEDRKLFDEQISSLTRAASHASFYSLETIFDEEERRFVRKISPVTRADSDMSLNSLGTSSEEGKLFDEKICSGTTLDEEEWKLFDEKISSVVRADSNVSLNRLGKTSDEEKLKLFDKKEIISSQAQTFWLRWVEAAFPDLDSHSYFMPPVYFNHVPFTKQSFAGQDVLVLQSVSGEAGPSEHLASIPSQATQSSLPQPPRVQDTDVGCDAAMQRVLSCLQIMSKQKTEVLFGLSQLHFSQYLGEPFDTATPTRQLLPASLASALSRNLKEGDFDVLLIHRHYGFLVFEVKTFSDNVRALKMPEQDIHKYIRMKLEHAVSKLSKAEAMLSHLVSDIAPGLRITKTIAFPNLTARQLQQAISSDTQLTQDLCLCLETTSDPADIAGVCLCSDQLSDPKTPWDVSSHVLRELGHWWQRRVAGAGPDSHMTSNVYKTLIYRVCGPATTVTVPCVSIPRVSVKSLGQAVWCTGECYTAVITLFPEQVHLLHTAPPRLFVTGPPGTGKTVVLLLMAIQWLRCGHHIYIVSTCDESRAACSMLYHLLLQAVKTEQSRYVWSGQLHLLQYDLEYGDKAEMAVKHLLKAARGRFLHVIADEAGPEYMSDNFQNFCDKLLTEVPNLHLWAASCFHGHAPAGWQVEYLTRPLRSPPAVVREVEQDELIINGDVLPYSERGVPDHTDGPPVKWLYHRGQGHSHDRPVDCVTCSRNVASFLHSLRVGALEQIVTKPTSATSIRGDTPDLKWRNMLVLFRGHVRESMGMVKELREAGIPVQVMKDDDIEDVATASSNVVWVADTNNVRGLERKVVVCVERDPAFSILSTPARLHSMSRCTSQLVIVSPYDSPPKHK